MTTKYVFSREFPSTPDRIVPLETREATLTMSEHRRLLDAALAGARAEAFVQGRLEGEADSAARLAAALELASARLETLAVNLGAIEEAASAEAIRFAHAFSLKLAGRLLDSQPMAQIENAARAIFEDLRGQPHVAIRVAPELVDAAKERLASISRERGFDGRLIVLGEPEIPSGDVRIEWADGGIVRDRARTEQSLAACIDHALAAGAARIS